MTTEEFRKLAEHYLYLDGATGSNLVRAGMPSGVCPERWILEHREVMLALQKEYVAAGTDILYAPTFTANRVKLAEYGLEKELPDMVERLVSISREAADSCQERKVYVAGDLTMTGEQLKPVGKMELEELIDIYKEQITALERAGVDLLVVETMMSLAETRAAIIAAKEVSHLPVMATLTFEKDGRTLFGTDAETAAVVLESLGVCALGVNCSTGPGQMRPIIETMAAATASVPIIAKPNAGLPYLDEQGRTCYDMDADEFVSQMGELTDAGATVLGGCCGTTPAYIRKLSQTFGRTPLSRPSRRKPGIRMLTSERRTLRFGLDGGFLVVGERINPTGKKQFQAELREGVTDRALQFAEEQEACGASVLDVNMGMSGIDEKEMMLRVIGEISSVSDLPLSLDSSHVDVLEAALRHYPGRALINSVSLEKEKFETLIPIVKKYGAMFILLPLSDKGLPENLEEKKQIIDAILERAYQCGLTSEDVVADGLVATVGANPSAALETLETIRYCRERRLATICGLSNISFGMPERSFINTAFLTLAIREGLTMAIANPSQELLMGCAMAADLLLAKEESNDRYLEFAAKIAENRERHKSNPPAVRPVSGGGPDAAGEKAPQPKQDGVSGAGPQPESGTLGKALETAASGGEDSRMEAIRHAVLKGNRNGIADLTREALQAGKEAQEILNDVLMPAINQVGELYDKGKYFLPQLIGSAEAMKNAIQVLEPLLQTETEAADLPVVVIATVEGDIHDIGKNLVALMLRNYGFRVVDLGKDVPAAKIIQAAKEHHAGIIALSALMTTTMQRMREVVSLAKKEGVTAKIMVGGAVITQDYADEIGADGFSRDAAEAVKTAQSLMEEGKTSGSK